MTDRERQIIADALRIAETDAGTWGEFGGDWEVAKAGDYERLANLFEQGGDALAEWFRS